MLWVQRSPRLHQLGMFINQVGFGRIHELLNVLLKLGQRIGISP